MVIGNGYGWFKGELCALSGPDVQFVLSDPEDEDSDGDYVYTYDDRPDLEKAKHPWTEEDWENYRKERERYYEEAAMQAKFPGYKPKGIPPKYRETDALKYQLIKKDTGILSRGIIQRYESSRHNPRMESLRV